MALAFKRSFVYHGLFPNFKVSALTIVTGLKRLGSVDEVLIQLPTNIPKRTLALSIVMTGRDESFVDTKMTATLRS